MKYVEGILEKDIRGNPCPELCFLPIFYFRLTVQNQFRGGVSIFGRNLHFQWLASKKTPLPITYNGCPTPLASKVQLIQ